MQLPSAVSGLSPQDFPVKNLLYFFLEKLDLKTFLIFSGNGTFLYFSKGIFKTLVYSEHWHIENPGIFRTMTYLEPKAYSERCQTSTMECFEKK